MDCVSAVKGMSGKEIAVGLVKFIAVPPDERAKALRGLHVYCGIFKELRGDLDDFAAALYAREVSEKIANGSDLMLAANWERIRNMSDEHKMLKGWKTLSLPTLKHMAAKTAPADNTMPVIKIHVGIFMSFSFLSAIT